MQSDSMKNKLGSCSLPVPGLHHRPTSCSSCEYEEFRDSQSGIPMSTSWSNRPNCLNAGSMELGQLVATITTTFERDFMPSISVSNCEMTQRSTSPFVCHAEVNVQPLQNMKGHSPFRAWGQSN